jgi:hypothetical protein
MVDGDCGGQAARARKKIGALTILAIVCDTHGWMSPSGSSLIFLALHP